MNCTICGYLLTLMLLCIICLTHYLAPQPTTSIHTELHLKTLPYPIAPHHTQLCSPTSNHSRAHYTTPHHTTPHPITLNQNPPHLITPHYTPPHHTTLNKNYISCKPSHPQTPPHHSRPHQTSSYPGSLCDFL